MSGEKAAVEYKGFSEEQLSEVISCIIGGEKFRAISLYRELDKESTSETIISDIIAIAAKISEWVKEKDFLMKHIPSVCCINCIGKCGRWKEMMKSGGYDESKALFCGSGCKMFKSANEFLKEQIGRCVSIVVKNNELERTQNIVKIKVEKKISSLSHEVYNVRQNRTLSCKKRIFLIDGEKMAKHILKIVRMNHIIGDNQKCDDSLTIKGIMPIEGDKNYSQYFTRCQKEIREKNIANQNRIYSLDYESACKEFLSTCSPTEKSIIESMGGNIKKYINDFYNGQSIWEVLENSATIA